MIDHVYLFKLVPVLLVLLVCGMDFYLARRDDKRNRACPPGLFDTHHTSSLCKLERIERFRVIHFVSPINDTITH